MGAPRVFDLAHYDSLNTARAAVVAELLSELKERMELRTAIDVGCGLGYFSAYLNSQGFQVLGVDGRQENVEEAQRRTPQVSFHTANLEDPAIRDLGRFDLVLCFGLLYHLENPFLGIRHLRALASQLALLESVIYPGDEPMMALVDEGPCEDQGLNHIAFYPTESCLVKLLFQVGFPHVYRFSKLPEHGDFRATHKTRQVRTMLAASDRPLQVSGLDAALEQQTHIRPWDPTSGVKEERLVDKLRRFAGKPFPNKVGDLKRRLGGSGPND